MTTQARLTSTILSLALALAAAGCGNGKLGEKGLTQKDAQARQPDGGAPLDAMLADGASAAAVGTIRITAHNRMPCPVAPNGVAYVAVALFKDKYDVTVDPKTGLTVQKGALPFTVKKTIGPCLVTAPDASNVTQPTQLEVGQQAVTIKLGSGPAQTAPLTYHKATGQPSYGIEYEPAPAAGTSVTVTVAIPGHTPVVRTFKLMEPLDFTSPTLLPTKDYFSGNNVYYVAHDRTQDLTLGWKASNLMPWSGSIHNYTNWTGDGGDTLRCFGTYGSKTMTIPAAALQYSGTDNGPYFTFDHFENQLGKEGVFDVWVAQNGMSRTFRLLGPKSSLWKWVK